MQVQLLNLFEEEISFGNFIGLKNEELITLLKDSNIGFIHLVGAPLSGKTHLLKAWVNYALNNNYTSVYFNDQNFNIADIKSVVSEFNYIAIDNIDQLTILQQENLFDLFNEIKLNDLPNRLLTSSTLGFEEFPLRVDLKTRLLSGINLTIKALNDQELIEAVLIYANQFGIKIGILELEYLINHYQRNIGSLINSLNLLSEAALKRRRHITIPLIKDVLYMI